LLGKADTKPQGVSNLVLASREARLTASSGLDFSSQNQWAALHAAHPMVSQKSEGLILGNVCTTKLEPTLSKIPAQRKPSYPREVLLCTSD